MAKNCCGQDACSCLLVAGDGIVIEGSGTQTNPYKITVEFPDFTSILSVRDTNSVNLTLFGSGVPADPFVLQADATVRLTELADVQDPQGGPSAGEVPVWVGLAATGHWEFQTPPPAPAGAVNVENGLTGVGSSADPIGVATSGVWGVAPLDTWGADSTVGLAIYVDSNGQLRAEPVDSTDPTTTLPWTSITGKPTTFAPIIGNTATTAVAGNDSRLTNARTPLAHDINGSAHTGTLSVANGGTGATTKAAARPNLGVFVQATQPSSSLAAINDLWFW